MKNIFIEKFIKENEEIFEIGTSFIKNLIENKNNDKNLEDIKKFDLYIKDMLDQEIMIRDPKNEKITISIMYKVSKDNELKDLSYMIDLKDSKTIITEDYISKKSEVDKTKYDFLINFTNKDVVTRTNFSCKFKLENLIKNKETKKFYFDNAIQDLINYVNGIESSKSAINEKNEILKLSSDFKGFNYFLEENIYFGVLKDNYKISKKETINNVKNKI